jgi:hypothetical protein
MSFPFLLSAVPLYVQDTREDARPLRKCWFSDGGLTSNLPLRFFDTPLPRRPTFAINLLPAGARTVAAPVWMPDKNPRYGETLLDKVLRFYETGNSLYKFFDALFETSRNWADTEQMFMPGFRDRIVHVSLSEKEGGFNLNMSEEVIKAIGERGKIAGKLLAARFHPEIGIDPLTRGDIILDWDNHRWIRYRSYMACLESVIRDFALRWNQEVEDEKAGRLHTGVPSLHALLERSWGELAAGKGPPHGQYPWKTEAQWEHAKTITKKLLDLAKEFGEPTQPPYRTFNAQPRRGENLDAGGAPEPAPSLRVVPPGKVEA